MVTKCQIHFTGSDFTSRAPVTKFSYLLILVKLLVWGVHTLIENSFMHIDTRVELMVEVGGLIFSCILVFVQN